MASIFNEVSQQKGKLECSVYLFLVPTLELSNFFFCLLVTF
jgi:hypothetical protein